MAATLQELTERFSVPPKAKAQEAPNHQHLPFWVVVMSKKPNPDGTPRFKYVIGMTTEHEAEAEAIRRANQPYEREHGFQFFTIKNPVIGG